MGLFSQDEEPIYKTNYLGFYIRVYPKRVDFKSKVGKQSVPISQIASLQEGMVGLMSITIETTGGKKYRIPTLKKAQVKKAIYQAQDQLG